MKAGFLFGRERDFPYAVIDRIKDKSGGAVSAESISLAGTRSTETIPYDVIVDRISHEVYYYRAYCKKAVADGKVVINNPFWWSADDKFFECVLAESLGVAVPKTVVLPSKEYPPDISQESLHNLVQPFPWEEVVAHTGFPAVLKPAIGGGNKNIHIVDSIDELKAAFDTGGELLMILQECIVYENYVRCWTIGREHVQISRYDHRLPRPERYRPGFEGIAPDLMERIERDCITLNRALGYDMNTVEFAIRDGIPYAIDFLNPAPDCDPNIIGRERFEWVVEHLADLVIEYCRGDRRPERAMTWQQAITAPSATGAGAVLPATAATAGGPA